MAEAIARDLESGQPGEWLSADGIPVDLLVPSALAAGRRGARIPPHDKRAMRRVVGLEAAMVDNELHEIAALEAADQRRCAVRVAGPGALLIAKLYKVDDSIGDRPGRDIDKDCLDIFRLLRLPPGVLADRVTMLRHDELAGASTNRALESLRAVFGGTDSPGSQRAARAAGSDPVVAAQVAGLAQELIEAVE